MKTLSESAESTFALGERLAESLVGGEVILLNGPLGAGKTVFVKGLARGLGITETVTSPTYALMNEYRGRLRLCHFDVYRLGSGGEACEAGLTSYFGEADAVCCIEWADNIASVLPRRCLRVNIDYADDGKRTVEIVDE